MFKNSIAKIRTIIYLAKRKRLIIVRSDDFSVVYVYKCTYRGIKAGACAPAAAGISIFNALIPTE